MPQVSNGLVSKSQSGDREAFDGLVERYGLDVLRVATLVLRDPALAEDVCQETFVRAWRQIGTLRNEDAGAWLRRIAINQSISAHRRRHRFDRLAERLGRLGLVTYREPGPDALDLRRALDRLDAQGRAAIVLHYYEDLSVEDTALALGVPVDTAKARLKVALRRLRALTQTEE